MFLVRNVFTTHPGKAKELVQIFKKAAPILEASGIVENVRVLTDAVAGFWTVVVESEVKDLNSYVDMAQAMRGNKELGAAMAGYLDLQTGGHREVFRIE